MNYLRWDMHKTDIFEFAVGKNVRMGIVNLPLVKWKKMW